jgi:succinyl-CoA synthetase beta subunit
MKIHEYQAKALFRSYAIPTPEGAVARTPQEVVEAARTLGSLPLVVKAQIHSGGRGKGGGIRIVHTPEEAEEAGLGLLGTRIVTPQAGPAGKPVDSLLIEQVIDGERELYLGVTIDRARECVTVLASGAGGMAIEEIAGKAPEKLVRELADPRVGLRPFQGNRIGVALGLNPGLARGMSGIVLNLYRLFVDKDCSLAEINPLVVTKAGRLVALDGKINFDDNSLFRHPDVQALCDTSQDDPREVEAARHNLNYIKLKGNVGCMVNGAGLAMATMDLIKLTGGEPANFLDVGGGASVDMVRAAFKILVADQDVRVILINIFGGILRCDTLALGVVEAALEMRIRLPIVVRMEGTNKDEGRRILGESGLSLIPASGLREAGEKVAEALRALEDKD